VSGKKRQGTRKVDFQCTRGKSSKDGTYPFVGKKHGIGEKKGEISQQRGEEEMETEEKILRRRLDLAERIGV